MNRILLSLLVTWSLLANLAAPVLIPADINENIQAAVQDAPGEPVHEVEEEKSPEISLALRYDSFLLPAAFSENYFSESAYNYNHELAWLTLCLELAANSKDEASGWGENSDDDRTTAMSRSAEISDAYDQMGFDTKEYHNYGVGLNSTWDKVAYSIGTRHMADGSTLVTAVIRGDEYGGEWASNFHLTEDAMNAGYHYGFYHAACSVYDNLTAELEEIDGPVKVWITGYSRGAAVANILAGMLDDYSGESKNLSAEHIYAYTFATPCGVLPVKNPEADLYRNIFNIINPGDLVPRVVPAEWGYTRYGRTLSFNPEAGDAVFQAVDGNFEKLLTFLDVPDEKLLQMRENNTFSAKRNIGSAAAMDAFVDALMTAYPTENSARHFLGIVRDLLGVTFQRKLENGTWEKLSREEALDWLRDRCGAKDINEAYDAAVGKLQKKRGRALLKATVRMLEKLGVTDFFLDAADAAIVFYTLGEYHGVSVVSTAFFLFRLSRVDFGDLMETMTDDGEEDRTWREILRDALKGPKALFVDPASKKLHTAEDRLREVWYGHAPYTYLSWMMLPEDLIFTGL